MTQAANVAASTPPSWTTANRPASPVVGQTGWNTTLQILEVWVGASWQQIASTAYAIDYLIVAGGGGGLYGAGGAGGLIQAVQVSVTPGTAYAFTIGAGGVGNSSAGSNTTGFTLTAIGGGSSYGARSGSIMSGGSGAGNQFSAANSGVLGSATAGQGNIGGYGGDGVSAYTSGGGGGGAGGVGATTGNANGGAGGIGVVWLNGSYYAGGGGGGTNAGAGGSGAAGGLGGGGAGTNSSTPNNGTANTGGGGGGAGLGASNGGSGIVIVRYVGTQRGTGGTITSAGGFTYHTFTTSGTYTA